MATPVIMPRQGQSVETCIITKWFKLKGDTVVQGDLLFSYETDKAAFDLESPASGILLSVFYDEGAEVPVLVTVAVIGEVGEEVSSYIPEASGKQDMPETGTGEVENMEPQPAIPPVIDEEMKGSPKTRISPRARRLGLAAGIDLSIIRGSGPNGRIIFSDVQKFMSAASDKTDEEIVQKDEYSEKPLTNVRKLIARSMHSSLSNSAQLTHHMSADVRRVLEVRAKIKEAMGRRSETQDITINDMICWCVIRALKKFPEANSHFLDDRIRTFNRVHLGIAVDTQRGLMVPAAKDADRMSLQELSAGLKAVAGRCKKGDINPELLQSTSATFTVSNLGNYGVEMFTPVINLPQVAILGVCTILYRPAALAGNTFGFIPFIGLSLTYDHRAIDGGPATLFLKEIKEQIENFDY